jgi:acyl-coenzyme A thioesterase PaaI-like protein
VWQASLQAIGRVVQHGRTVGLVECDILDADEVLVARATSTCMTLRGDQARGR